MDTSSRDSSPQEKEEEKNAELDFNKSVNPYRYRALVSRRAQVFSSYNHNSNSATNDKEEGEVEKEKEEETPNNNNNKTKKRESTAKRPSSAHPNTVVQSANLQRLLRVDRVALETLESEDRLLIQKSEQVQYTHYILPFYRLWLFKRETEANDRSADKDHKTEETMLSALTTFVSTPPREDPHLRSNIGTPSSTLQTVPSTLPTLDALFPPTARQFRGPSLSLGIGAVARLLAAETVQRSTVVAEERYERLKGMGVL
ncbi:hypothetical protein ADEAN_000131000 [Angomonas deanei]|uniref:Uncharacterized protein n=1 Tax=Angomonas deanei TaxID=59799 RepID=A0A7G2C533_9TRYP|nr:hypothetical protein ADEAN_000131000 [Angomonas deanei]